jgi:hypothetical protein
LLNAMIAADPQGAASAKALLAAAYGKRFQRIPWGLNDTRPGRALLNGMEPAPVISLWPNPTNAMFTVESDEPIRSVTIHDAAGRVLRHYSLANSLLIHVSDVELVPGSYAVQVITARGPRSIKLLITP